MASSAPKTAARRSAFADAASSPDSAKPYVKPSGLWQVPLLVVSLALFTLAAYLLIDPRSGIEGRRHLEIARAHLDADRHEAALGVLNTALAARPPAEDAAALHLLAAETLDAHVRRNRRSESPQVHRRIVDHVLAAYDAGTAATGRSSERLARSYEALGEIDAASTQYRLAADAYTREHQADPTGASAVPVKRSLAEMLVEHDRPASADLALRDLLDTPGLDDQERAWTLGELARLRVDADRPAEAMSLLAEALSLSPDETIRGQVNFRLGYAAYRLGDDEGAWNYLEQARRQLGTGHATDAEACLLMGQIAQKRQQWQQAIDLYDTVIFNHPGSRPATRARLGRGSSRLVLGEDVTAGVADLVDVTRELRARPGLDFLASAVEDALRQASRILATRGRYDDAVTLMAEEQALRAEVGHEFFERLSAYFERMGEQVRLEVASADEADAPALEARWRKLMTKAGDAAVAQSRQLTLDDDSGYGEALWRGVALYERAANLPETVAALEVFVAERPGDPLAPEALFRLGRTYQALGRQDKAVDTFVTLRGRYPQTLSAAEAAAPLAQAYIARGETTYPQAEGVLRSVVDDNPVLSPQSQTFRHAVWELANLYYRSGRYGEALARLEEFTSRYGDDWRGAQVAFLKADCYRQTAAAARSDDSSDAESLRRRHLASARTLFDGVVEAFAREAPRNELEQTYERLAYFYRADCLFDLGEYEQAVALYDVAAYRYQDDPSALGAYVQIVNAYARLGRNDDARVANERAKWLLRRIPPEAFTDGRMALSREYWEQWLKWAGDTGMW